MSSILDNGPHTIVVYRDKQQTDTRGNIVQVPDAVGVLVHGVSITPMPSRIDDGRVQAVHRMMARSAPIGPWSRVKWNGATHFVVSGPTHISVSPDVQHVSAVLQEER